MKGLRHTGTQRCLMEKQNKSQNQKNIKTQWHTKVPNGKTKEKLKYKKNREKIINEMKNRRRYSTKNLEESDQSHWHTKVPDGEKKQNEKKKLGTKLSMRGWS